MLVLITGLHVLHGPQPSLIKTLIKGEEVSGKAITRWVSSNNNKDFIRCRLPLPVRKAPALASHPYQSTASRKRLLITLVITCLITVPFVIRFRNVSRPR